jgi:hypothetical protein
MRTRPASCAGDGLILRFDPKRGRRGLIEDGWTLVETGGVASFGAGGVVFPAGSYATRRDGMLWKTLSILTVVANVDVIASSGTARTILSAATAAGTPRFEVGMAAADRRMRYTMNVTTVASTNEVTIGKRHLVWSLSSGVADAFYSDAVANGSGATAFGAVAPGDVRIGHLPTTGQSYGARIYNVRVYSRAWVVGEASDDYREYA